MWYSRLYWAVLLCGLGFSLGIPRTVIAQSDVGYKDFTYGANVAPTGEKPQSKLWYNDGSWWGILYNSTSTFFEIYKFNWASQSWTATGTQVDGRMRLTHDALMDGNRLYIATAVVPGVPNDPDSDIYIRSFFYDPISQSYSLEWLTIIPSNPVESVVIDKDTTGTLWITYTDIVPGAFQSVFITHSQATPSDWATPYVLPFTEATNLDVDDISTLINYSGKIGVMWSNQTDGAVYFATHTDGTDDTLWTVSTPLSGPKYADDHLNIKSLAADPAGQVFAVVKTSLNDIYPNSGQPLIMLLTLDDQGGWGQRIVSRVWDSQTRPIVLIDTQNRQLYVFATYTYPGQQTGAIYYKQASLDNPSVQFPDGIGTPFIEFSQYQHINNASSTKQALDGTTNLLVIASEDLAKSYFHNVIDLPPIEITYPIYLPLIMRE
jgi:hypothetical protein